VTPKTLEISTTAFHPETSAVRFSPPIQIGAPARPRKTPAQNLQLTFIHGETL
jgi:hypothetical protein